MTATGEPGPGAPAHDRDLLERAREVATLRRMLEAAEQDDAGIALIEGEAGIGKTSLLRTVEEQARERGWTVLAARCASLETDFAFGAARQLLGPALAAAGEDDRIDLLSGSAALARPVLSAEARRAGMPTRSGAHAALHGLYWVTANLAARGPVLLAVDDLHWIDAPSLRWLTYLARRLDGLPVVVALTARVPEPAIDLALVAELTASPRCEVLRPTALSGQAVAGMVRGVLGGDAAEVFCEACALATGGNPYYLRELLDTLAADGIRPSAEAAMPVLQRGPQAVSRHILARLDRLHPGVLQLARALAVLDGQARLPVAAALAGLEPDEAARHLTDLERLGIMRAVGAGDGNPGFAHAIVRASIYRDMPPAQRDAWHARAAEVLDAGGAAVELVAAHLLACAPGGNAAALQVLTAAAEEATERGAPDVAAAYLRRALREPPPDAERVHLLVALGQAELFTDAPAAARHLAEALDRTGEPEPAAGISVRLARALFLSGRGQEAVRLLQQAHAAVADHDPALALLVESELVYSAWAGLRNAAFAHQRLEALDPDRLAGGSHAERALLSMLAMKAVCHDLDLPEALELSRRALAKGLLPDAGRHWGAVFLFALWAGVFADRVERADQVLADAVAEARRRGSLPLCALLLAFQADLAYRRGNLVDAVTYGEAALDAVHVEQLGQAAPYVLAFLIQALVERDRLDQAEQILEQHGYAGELDPFWANNLLLTARGQVRMARGQPQRALEDFTEAGRRALAWGVLNPAPLAWRSHAALAHLALGEQEQAAKLAAEELALARRWGAPSTLGMALRGAGLAAGPAEGLALLSEAVDKLERSPARLELARALTVLGAAVRQAGRHSEARTVLQRATDLSERCGATALAERALQELIVAGGRPRRLPHARGDALTPSEQRVAAMAAEGQTNRDIAQTLFVTQRTVEIHLTQAYRKLGIAGRAQLTAALEDS